MRIDFKKIIQNSGESLTKAQLAREMVSKGIFKNQTSAYLMMQYHERGDAKSVDFEMLNYLMKRFNLTACQILN
jgi:hypothetical protein